MQKKRIRKRGKKKNETGTRRKKKLPLHGGEKLASSGKEKSGGFFQEGRSRTWFGRHSLESRTTKQ